MSSNKQIFTALVNFVDQLVKVYDDERAYKFLYNYNAIIENLTFGDVGGVGRNVNALRQYLEFNKPLLLDRKLENAISPYDKLVYLSDSNGQPKIYIDFVKLLNEAPSNKVKDAIYKHLYHLAILCFPDWVNEFSMVTVPQETKIVPEGVATTVDEAKKQVKDIMTSVKSSFGSVDKSKGLVGVLELFTGDSGHNIVKQMEGMMASNLDGKQMAVAALQALQEEMQSGNIDLSKMLSSFTGGGNKSAVSDPRLSEKEIVEMAEQFKRVDMVHGITQSETVTQTNIVVSGGSEHVPRTEHVTPEPPASTKKTKGKKPRVTVLEVSDEEL